MENTMMLFKKEAVKKEAVKELTTLLSEHKFYTLDLKKYNKDFNVDTVKLAHVGLTKQKSSDGKGTLISVWNTNKATDKAINVRISNDLHNTLSAKSEAIKILLDTASYKDSDELCIKFYSVHDVIVFFSSLFAYVEAVEAKKEVKEVEKIESVMA